MKWWRFYSLARLWHKEREIGPDAVWYLPSSGQPKRRKRSFHTLNSQINKNDKYLQADWQNTSILLALEQSLWRLQLNVLSFLSLSKIFKRNWVFFSQNNGFELGRQQLRQTDRWDNLDWDKIRLTECYDAVCDGLASNQPATPWHPLAWESSKVDGL